MGAGIAYVSAQAGIEVVLLDRDMPSAEKGKAHSDELSAKAVQRGRMSARGKGRAARAHQADRRLCRPRRRRPRHRGGVRGPRREGGGDSARRCAHLSERRDLRLQHLDAADHLARRDLQGPETLHRHPFLLAGRPHDAGRDHPRARRRATRRSPRRSTTCAQIKKTPIVVNDCARLLRQSLRHGLSARRPSDARRRRAAGDDRERRAHGRHAGRAAVAHRRDRRRPRLEDPAGDQEGRRHGDPDRTRRRSSCSKRWW